MADELIYISDFITQIYTFCRLQLVVETFGHLTIKRNQKEIIKIPQSCLAKYKKTL